MYISPNTDDLGHVYIYSERTGLIDPQLICSMRCTSSVHNPRLMSQTRSKRLSQHEQTNAQEWRIDSPRSSWSKVVARRLSSYLSSVQVVALVLGSEGAPTANSVMDLRMEPVDDGSEYLPR